MKKAFVLLTFSLLVKSMEEDGQQNRSYQSAGCAACSEEDDSASGLSGDIQERLQRLVELSQRKNFFTIDHKGASEIINFYKPSNTIKEIKEVLRGLSKTMPAKCKSRVEMQLFFIQGNIGSNLKDLGFQLSQPSKCSHNAKLVGRPLIESAKERNPELAKEWQKIIDGREATAIHKLFNSVTQ